MFMLTKSSSYVSAHYFVIKHIPSISEYLCIYIICIYIYIYIYEEYPLYGFASHKGYGTEAHVEAITIKHIIIIMYDYIYIYIYTYIHTYDIYVEAHVEAIRVRNNIL